MSRPETAAWWRSAVVYQVYPRSFADSDGDGVGDLRGVIDHLDHLDDLGVDVLWLSPVYASPQADNGYDISDYQSIAPVFGTLDDFDELVAQAHGRGIRLVLDMVVNHTSDQHPWFVESASGADSPKRDWYWWRRPRPGAAFGEPGAEPTNWTSFFSGPTWTADAASREYYLHLFSPRQPDLNWENPQVRRAIYDMMRWWVDRGVDGFRMDVVNLLSKDPALPDGPVRPGEVSGDGFASYGHGPRIHEFLQEMRREVLAGRDDLPFVIVGETPGVTVDQARLYTDPARGELDMVFQFDHMGVDHGPGGKWDVQPLDIRALKASFRRWQDGLADCGWNSLYWCNHDQPRPVSRFGDDGAYWRESATALATVLHLQRGTPFVYQGEEIGMRNRTFSSVDDFEDIESINHYRSATLRGEPPAAVLDALRRMSRDNARAPFPWDEGPTSGLSTTPPWTPVGADGREVSVAAERGVKGSIYEHYRALVALRHAEPAVVDGRFEMLLPDDAAIFAFLRRWHRTELLVVANLSGVPQTATFGEEVGDDEVVGDAARVGGRAGSWPGAEVVLTNQQSDDAGTGDPVWLGPSHLALRPWEAVVLRRTHGAGAAAWR
ncbi:alpha-glucosidase [Cellulomonas sp. KRMCY2]|uniref:glycoside hydrolase family 13 protein n=1 Tax=Cellulomonas sp. KRMCY2 TaxID=1304865 RepID=UPI00045E667B|nr:alpha-glucosidase [Cellulomonas sp. KRMCY2]